MYNFNKNFYSDIRIEDTFTTFITYKNKALESLTVRNEKRAFIRVYDGKLWYYTSTSDIDNIQNELDNLYLQAEPNEKIEENPIVKKYEINKETLIKFDKISARNIDKSQKIKLVESLIPLVDRQYIAMSQILYKDVNNVYEFYSSKGAEIKYDYQLMGYAVFGVFSNGIDHVQAGGDYSSVNFDDLFGHEDKVIKKFDKAENFLLHAKPCVKGSFPVVLSPEGSGIFAHESFGHKSESDFMIGDETMMKEWVLGKQVGSPLLSIYDSGVDFGSGYVPFDDEGTRAKKTYLIKDGILTGRLHSAFTSAVLNEDLTGNARAMNCKFEPIVRMTSTVIDSGTSTFDDLIAGIDDGYYIESVMHGSGETTFTIAPSISYEIKNGKIGDPVKISVVTGNVFETLGLIDGVSRECEIHNGITGGCGKMEQSPLHVAFGGPYIRVSKMNVQ